MENSSGNPFGKCLVGFPYISKFTEYFPCLCIMWVIIRVQSKGLPKHPLCHKYTMSLLKTLPTYVYIYNYIYTLYIFFSLFSYRLQHIAALFPLLCFDASPSIPNSSIFRAAEWSSAIATSQCPASRHALMPMLMLSSHLSLEVSQSDTKGWQT